MAAIAHSRHHRQMFLIALRSAKSKGDLERAIEAHCKHMTPADHAEARSALAVRAAELSPNQPTTKEAK